MRIHTYAQTYAYVAWAGRNRDDHSGARRQAPQRALVVGTDGMTDDHYVTLF